MVKPFRAFTAHFQIFVALGKTSRVIPVAEPTAVQPAGLLSAFVSPPACFRGDSRGRPALRNHDSDLGCRRRRPRRGPLPGGRRRQSCTAPELGTDGRP